MNNILEIRNLSKSFPGVQALDDVSIGFNRGEVHALVGMNGSGKSTLLKILTGIYKQDAGDILLDGQVHNMRDVAESQSLGISMVYQELSLVPCLTVAENIFLGDPVKKYGLVNLKEAKKKAKNLLEKLSIDIDPNLFVEDLTLAKKQMVEIVKALSIKEKILLLDEPSAVLTKNELDSLFELILKLKSNGVTVVYISHRLEEVFEIADRVTVLRDGKYIGTEEVKDLKPNDLVKMLIGKSLNEFYPEFKCSGSDKKVLEIKNLTSGKLKNISLHLFEREIIGIYGMVGMGQKEFVESLFGLSTEDVSFDTFEINGKEVKINSPFDGIKNGMAYIPEERKEEGLMLNLNIRENIEIPFLDRLSTKLGLIKSSLEKKETEKLIKQLGVKTPSADTEISTLSGGNQQKVVIAKWVGKGSKILICFEPTRGIDINAKAEVYKVIDEMREKGAAVIIISSDLSEIVGMAERGYVISNYEFVEQFNPQGCCEETVLIKASGLEACSENIY